MAQFMGMPIIIDANCLEVVPRTVKERFFSKPWKPLKKRTRIPTCYVANNKTIIAHPAIIKEIESKA